MVLLLTLVIFILLGLLTMSNGKCKQIDDENIKLRLENNVLKNENKDLCQQLKSYVDYPEQLFQV